MAAPDFDQTFEGLKAVLRRFESRLVKVHDLPDHYYLDTAHIQQNRKPLFFGAVRRGKQYVSFHLMAVYIWPNLLDTVSDQLKRRMQGKSCFNFKSADPDILRELGALTQRAFELYREAGYVT